MMTDQWRVHGRPGYFGRKRDERIAGFDRSFGIGNWRLGWLASRFATLSVLDERVSNPVFLSFFDACAQMYEESYVRFLKQRPADVDFVCSYGECIDNAPTNIQSGCDYTIQEAYSTHIQDIAVRNALRRLGRRFEGPAEKVLVIRTKGDGQRFGPGVVPFYAPDLITPPSLAPRWAEKNSVEDYWQSNKFLLVRSVCLAPRERFGGVGSGEK